VCAEATELAHELYAIVADVAVFSRHLSDLKPALRDPLLKALTPPLYPMIQVRAEATEVAHELYAIVADVAVFSRHLSDLKPALRDPLLEALEKGRPLAQSINGRTSGGGGTGRTWAAAGGIPGGAQAGQEEGEGDVAVEPDQCQFCLRRDPAWESEEALDLHFWKECPMLSSCEQCAQVRGLSSKRAPCSANTLPTHTHCPASTARSSCLEGVRDAVLVRAVRTGEIARLGSQHHRAPPAVFLVNPLPFTRSPSPPFASSISGRSSPTL
jgi:hypothetical protein